MDISLDSTLDDLADLKGFDPPLTGSYKVVFDDLDIRALSVTDSRKAGFLNFTIQQVMELGEQPDAGTEPPKEGGNMQFMSLLDNEIGQGVFKKNVAVLAEKLGTKNMREIKTRGKGMVMLLVVKRSAPNAEGRRFANIVNCGVL